MASRTSQPSRALRTFDATAMVTGNMIGSGIFLLAGYAAATVVTGFHLMLAWVLGGMMALWGTLTTAELASRFPHTGGDFLYLHRVYGRYPAFLYGWMSLVVFGSGSIGILAIFSGTYLLRLFPGIGSYGLSEAAVASLAVVFYTLLHSIRITIGARFQSILTVIKVTGIAMLAYVLYMGAGGSRPVASFSPNIQSPAMGLARALVPIFFTYSGWNVVGYVAGEVKNPRATLPIAFIVGTLTTLLLYLVLNGAFLSVLGLDRMRGDQTVPLTALESIASGGWTNFFTILIFVSVFSSLSIAIQSGARVVQSMAEHGVFFRKVAVLHSRWATPVSALVLQGVWSIMLIHTLNVETLVDSTTVIMVLFSALTISTVFKSRKMSPGEPAKRHEPFRPPFPRIIPLAYIGSCLFIAIGVIQFYLAKENLQERLLPVVGFGLIVIGSIIYVAWNRLSVQTK